MIPTAVAWLFDFTRGIEEKYFRVSYIILQIPLKYKGPAEKGLSSELNWAEDFNFLHHRHHPVLVAHIGFNFPVAAGFAMIQSQTRANSSILLLDKMMMAMRGNFSKLASQHPILP